MPKYLTVAAYKAAGDGVPLSGVSDLVLARAIADAETLIDSYCRVPSLAPLTVTDEIHEWNGLTRRVRFDCAPVPVTAVTRFLIQISSDSQGNMLTANVNPADVVINHDEGYAEVVSMTTLTMGLTPVLINLGLQPALIHVDYSAGYSFTASDEPLYDSGDHLTYQAVRPLWDGTVPAVVKKNGVTQASGVTVDYTEGTVTFDSPNSAADRVTASYTYHVPDDVRAATIATTSMLLGERALNTMGLTNLELARGGRMYEAQRPRGQASADLPPRVTQLLGNYRHLALGGV